MALPQQLELEAQKGQTEKDHQKVFALLRLYF